MNSFSFGTFTEKFYEEKKDHLASMYPGLSLNRLKQELENYSVTLQLGGNDLFDTLYVPSLNNPFTIFFERLKLGMPLEYIRGKSYFYRSEFSVNADVLIPRSETEILVERAIAESQDWVKKTDEKLKIADIGTGSGAIILSMMQELNRPIYAVATDISKAALKVARRNFFNLRYTISRQSELNLLKMDRLSTIDEKFHIIVSNPPYIKEAGDRENVHSQVESFEPHLALYINDEKYDAWFEKLFSQVKDHLFEEGVFIMEGHEDHLASQAKQIEELGFSKVEVIQDYTGRDRFLIARKL
jgi:release factor glutamine methyltransferase